MHICRRSAFILPVNLFYFKGFRIFSSYLPVLFHIVKEKALLFIPVCSSCKFFMKKIFYTIISILLIFFLLFFPQEALLSAQEGMRLWLNILLPTLLPFMILTGILIRTDCTAYLPASLEPFWQKIFGISSAGSCALLFGLLCGYPMGAKLTSDLYTSQKISRREAQYLLTFTNHASPVFISSYLIHTCMNDQIPAFKVFGLLLISAWLTMTLMRLWYFRKNTSSEISDTKKETSSPSSPEAVLDASIMNGFETITKLGGYILMFSILNACIRHFWKNQTILSHLLFCLLEMTTGLHQLSLSDLDTDIKYLCALVTVVLGGACVTAQTRSLVTEKLSMIPYLASKLLNALIVMVLYLFVTKVI